MLLLEWCQGQNIWSHPFSLNGWINFSWACVCVCRCVCSLTVNCFKSAMGLRYEPHINVTLSVVWNWKFHPAGRTRANFEVIVRLRWCLACIHVSLASIPDSLLAAGLPPEEIKTVLLLAGEHWSMVCSEKHQALVSCMLDLPCYIPAT